MIIFKEASVKTMAIFFQISYEFKRAFPWSQLQV